MSGRVLSFVLISIASRCEHIEQESSVSSWSTLEACTAQAIFCLTQTSPRYHGQGCQSRHPVILASFHHTSIGLVHNQVMGDWRMVVGACIAAKRYGTRLWVSGIRVVSLKARLRMRIISKPSNSRSNRLLASRVFIIDAWLRTIARDSKNQLCLASARRMKSRNSASSRSYRACCCGGISTARSMIVLRLWRWILIIFSLHSGSRHSCISPWDWSSTQQRSRSLVSIFSDRHFVLEPWLTVVEGDAWRVKAMFILSI